MASRNRAGLFIAIQILCAPLVADEPVLATVKSNEISVRSGPGKAFYATSKLMQGEHVEVYKINNEGWCAIRPPKGSFSLVLSKQVNRVGQSGVVVVSEAGVRSRVGSQISDQKNVQYVRLRKGEKLELLDREANPRPHDWIKVAPPSGEFRWIHKSHLAMQTGFDTGSEGQVGESYSAGNTSIANSNNVKVESIDVSAVSAPTISVSSASVSPASVETASIEPVSASNASASVSVSAEGDLENHGSVALIANQFAASSIDSQADSTSGIHASSPLAHQPTRSTDASPTVESFATEITSGSNLTVEVSPSGMLLGGMSTEPIPVESAVVPPQALKIEEPVNASTPGWIARQVTLPEQVAPSPDPLAPSISPLHVAPRPPIADQSQVAAATATSAAGADYSRHLGAINLVLSKTVSQEIHQWNLAPLRRGAEKIINLATDQQQRAQATQLLQRITEFENLRQRSAGLPSESRRIPSSSAVPQYQQLNAGVQQAAFTPGHAQYRNTQVPNQQLGQQQLGQQQPSQLSNNVYDGAGWLMPVLTERADLPKYALTDDAGSILHFVSPQSGLNLKPFLKKRIGIIGQSGYLPQVKKSHLAASRVIVLR